MMISTGLNKLPQKIKYIIIILTTSILTLFFEQIINSLRTYNLFCDEEWLILNSVDYISNGKFKNSSDDICYAAKVDEANSLLENMYFVEKKIEYEEFLKINSTTSYQTDDEALHQEFKNLQDEFKWSLWDGQNSFYKRIREAFMKKDLKQYKETSPYLILEEISNDKSFYVICNRFYKKKNIDRSYYMIQIFMQNKNEFVYLSHFGWGELVGNYEKKELTEKFSVVFDNYFSNIK